MKWLLCSEGSTTSTGERSSGGEACCMAPRRKRNQTDRPRRHNLLCAFYFYFGEKNLIELPNTLVQPRIHKTNTSSGRYLQYTKNYAFNVHTPAVNTLQEDTTTPGKAAADSDNSSTAAVYQAVAAVAGTLGVGNQDTAEVVAGVEVENPHYYTDAAAAAVVVATVVVVVVGHSSCRIRYHCVAEPTV